MRPQWCLLLAAFAGLCWAGWRPAAAWGTDLELALGDPSPLVVLVAVPDRPCSEPTRSAVDAAWNELRPRAQRVLLEHFPPRLGDASALCLCVLAPGGELVARCDGALDSDRATDWLREALEAANDPVARDEEALRDPRKFFERAQRDLRLGAIESAQSKFTQLASSPDPNWRLAARERLARISVDRGEIARAREQLDQVCAANTSSTISARLLFTRGSIELAERKDRAACATLENAARALASSSADESESARFELARAQCACGEESQALALLDELARTSSSLPRRRAAQAFAVQIRSSP